MYNQEKMTKTIYAVLHFEEQFFKMHRNSLKQDVIEWNSNNITVGNQVLWLNGELVDDIEYVINYIKTNC